MFRMLFCCGRLHVKETHERLLCVRKLTVNVCYWSKTQLGYSIFNLDKLNSVAMSYSTWTSTGSCRFTGPSTLSKRFFILVSCLVSSSVRVRSIYNYYPLPRMRSKGYCNRSGFLVSVCTSHSSLVSGYITQYFGQLGFERHGIEANRNRFSSVRFVVRVFYMPFYMPTLEVPFLN